jgi:hypothetical protein
MVFSQNYLSSRLQLAALASEVVVLHNLRCMNTNTTYVTETTFA